MRVIRAGKLVFAFLLLAGLWSGSAQALSLQQVGAGFEEPIYVTSDPANPDRLFVVERPGSIQLVENGEVKPFADFRGLVSCCGGERGLQSIALAPDFASSGRFFVFYTGEEEPGEIHVAEMRAFGSNAPTGSLRDLLTIPHPGESNHYGGQLQFGPEGNLFVSTGDGGGENDEHQNAQDLNSELGKILRIGVNPSGALPHTVPADNPFAGVPGADPIWSYGLRNPFRFSFDRLTGDLWIGDVGQGVKEEVDRAPAPGLGGGWNYGWNCYEGTEPGPATDPGCAGSEKSAFVFPVFEYTNPALSCAAVIGGYVARGPGYGDLFGRYLYGDLCAGDLRSFAPAAPAATDRDEGVHIDSLNSFGEDSCGRLYAVSGEGPVYRLVGPGGALCPSSSPLPVLAPSRVGIRAITKRVLRNRRALITAWVSPCNGRRGQPVTLWRGRKKIGTRHLDRVCSARFRPRINRRSRFRATVKADATYLAAISRKVTVKIKKHRPRHRGRR